MEKIWLKSYSPGVPHEIAVDDLGSIGDTFEESVRLYGERTAFVSGAAGVGLTYRQLDALSRNVAAYLQSVLKLAPGSRVALMLPNLLQFPVCLLGALRAGCVVVNVNPLYTARELEHQLADSGTEAIFILENMAHVLEKAIARTPVRHVVVTGVGDLLGFPKRQLAHFVVRRVKKMVPPFSLPDAASFDAMLARGAAARFEKVKVASGDLAFLQYTGGTTGVSKGAMLTHRNLLANARQGAVWSDPFIDPAVEYILVTAIPLYHIFALGAAVGHLGRGGVNVLVSDPRNTDAFVKVLAKYRFVALPAVNTLFNSLVHHPDFPRVDFSRLKFAIGGGAAVQRAVAERWQQITGVPLCEGYGLTECSPTVTVNPLDIEGYTGSIGLPVPSTDISIRDEEGRELPIDTPGELCVRGPQVMKGYWNRPDETARVMTPDGYLRTGDVAAIDAKGFVRIVDRKKDLILVSGFNVYPNEVEQVVAMHPHVLEAAAVGVPDDASGEAVKLYVVKKDPALTAGALIAHCRESLTAYKVPRLVEFIDELPKSNVGKVLRRELRERR
ncbi:MAG: AMP-binding protein [Rhodocyclaceae bacterium]|nr:AMP-binding protein [Rhodocyclaceae bacterium]GIK24257.1 MAG: long-chain-fatty-acid--CoA ligase [Betaproteobacteria bacterium]